MFLPYQENPFFNFYEIGLNVSLSTDDPLIMHLTDEPLTEEYAIAKKVWKLNNVDLNELFRYSCMQSCYEDIVKRHWLGDLWDDETCPDYSLKNGRIIKYRYA